MNGRNVCLRLGLFIFENTIELMHSERSVTRNIDIRFGQIVRTEHLRFSHSYLFLA